MIKAVYYIYFGLSILLISGCVETLPFVQDENSEKKLFVECELEAGKDIIAYVSYASFINNNSTNLPSIDTSEIRLSLGEMDKDYVKHFSFNQSQEKYVLHQGEIPLQSGKSYILKGFLKHSDTDINVVTELPNRFPYDSIVLRDSDFENLASGLIRTTSTIRIYFNRGKITENYFLHLAIMNKENDKEIYFQAASDANAFFRLNHKPGMVLELDRVTEKKYIELEMRFTGTDSLKEVLLLVRNTTKSYYDYQKFKTNTPVIPSPSTNPAIAAFNIATKEGYGTFSSSFLETLPLQVK
ncbi:MAG: hypothetical protein WAT79_01455 [Saprospiraceae bacterium]